jgi:hypothetical protein
MISLVIPQNGDNSSLSLFHSLASSLCVRINTIPVFVLVFSGAISPLARARIKQCYVLIELHVCWYGV